MLEQLIGKKFNDKYQIDRLLGQGGMGAVYKATHLGTKRTVALKVIAPEFMANAEFVERFRREAEAAGRLRHPNVVNVTDFGFATLLGKEFAYLVMEYLDGFSLATLLRKKKTLPLAFIADLVEQVALAINSAHKKGIIHRDLKPDNIWLEPNGRGGYNVIVLDFGLAKLRDTALQETLLETKQDLNLKDAVSESATVIQPPQVIIDYDKDLASDNTASIIKPLGDNDKTFIQVNAGSKAVFYTSSNNERLTMVGVVLGTPLYMSPEQCRGENIDNKADIYSLAVIVYEAIAGRPPFIGNLEEILSQHRKAKPASLKEYRRDIPLAIEEIVMSALEKDPAKRPANALAFATALRVNISGEVPLLHRGVEFYRENYLAILATFLVVLFPLLLLSLSFLFIFAFTETLNVSNIHYIHKFYWIFFWLLLMLGQPFLIAGYTLAWHQWQTSNRKISFKFILTVLRDKFWPLLFTSISTFAINIFQLCKLIVPGINYFIDHALIVPVILFENKSGAEARTRSKLLVKHVRPIAAKLQIRLFFWTTFSLLLPIFILSLMGLSFDIFYAIKVAPLETVFTISYSYFLQLLAYISLLSLGILYDKAREANGEELPKKLNDDFEKLEVANRFISSNWRVALLLLILAVIIIFTLILRNDPLLLAAELGQTDTIKSLLAKGTDINVINFKGETALMNAAAAGRVSIVKMLTEAGANVNARTNKGDTALIYAATNGRSFSVLALLSANANINAVNNKGATALILAAYNGYHDTVKELLNAGADADIKDIDGKTALIHARENEHPETVKILEQLIKK